MTTATTHIHLPRMVLLHVRENRPGVSREPKSTHTVSFTYLPSRRREFPERTPKHHGARKDHGQRQHHQQRRQARHSAVARQIRDKKYEAAAPQSEHSDQGEHHAKPTVALDALRVAMPATVKSPAGDACPVGRGAAQMAERSAHPRLNSQ